MCNIIEETGFADEFKQGSIERQTMTMRRNLAIEFGNATRTREMQAGGERGFAA